MSDSAETSDERRDRMLRELEGRNVAYYSVLLQTTIASELEAAKQIAGFSSAGIGLIFTVAAIKAGVSGALWTAVLCAVSLVCFGVAVIASTLYLRKAGKMYELELKGVNTPNDGAVLHRAKRKFSTLWVTCLFAFCLAVVSLAVAGVVELF